jgi:replicative DNA helicase
MNNQDYLHMVEERGLPCNLDAERLILGSMMLDSEAFMPGVIGTLQELDFSTQGHRLIFRRSLELFERAGKFDRVTLAHMLHERGELESVEGVSYLCSLEDGLPRLPDLDGYFRTVRDCSLKRQAIHAHQKGITEIMHGCSDAAEHLAKIQTLFAEISNKANDDGEFQTPGEVVIAAGGIDSYLQRRRASGTPTHIPSLNGLTRGLQAGSLNILAARTSRGKTAFALNIAVHVAKRTGETVVVFSHEMNKQEITDRIISLAGGMSFADLRTCKEIDRIRKAFNAADALPIKIRDASATVPAIHAKVRRLMTRQKIGLVIVDYLQLLTATGRSENRTQDVSALSRGLKLTAQELNIPFLVLSQLKRFDDDREPALSDLRESGSIEQDANTVAFLHASRDFDELDAKVPAPMQLILAKNRNGATGRIDVKFDRSSGRFVETTQREEEK